MNQHQRSWHARRAITAAVVTGLVPAAGQAATAGRVDFAVGDVTGVDTAGVERSLKKGSTIREGDTIRTARGRAQLRFTDGSRTALLPNTEFRVDEYRFDGAETPESRSFFSLVKGGLRTITGAIGKLRKRAYRVTTPVATIGIRGTEYLLVLGNSGDLRVGAGEVVAVNNAGEHRCSGFCYVPSADSQIRYVEDHPIWLPTPLERPRGEEQPGSSGDGAHLAGLDVASVDPLGSISPSAQGLDGSVPGGPDPGGPDPGGPDPGLPDGKSFVVAVAYGDDTEGAGQDVFLRGDSDLVDVTFDPGGGMQRYVDDPVSADRDTATLKDVGSAGPLAGVDVIGWSRWEGGSYSATGEGLFDNPYGLTGCTSPCAQTRGLTRGGSHHQVVITPPAAGERLAADTIYKFALAGFTTPTMIRSPDTNPSVDRVSGGELLVNSSGGATVQVLDMTVVANNGANRFVITSDPITLDAAKNFTFQGSGPWADVGGASGPTSTEIKGGLSTGFSHAGFAYRAATEFGGNDVVGVTAWEQVGKVPAE